MVKQFHMSLRDLDPDGIVRHEDLVGIKLIEQYYIEKGEKDAGRARAKSKSARKH
jgi:hypothetical protein